MEEFKVKYFICILNSKTVWAGLLPKLMCGILLLREPNPI